MGSSAERGQVQPEQISDPTPLPSLPEGVDIGLLPVNADAEPSRWLPLVRAAVQRTQQCLFILFTGQKAAQPPCQQLIRLAAAALEMTATEDRPQLQLVPLFPAAGWVDFAAGRHPGQLQAAALQGLQVVWADSDAETASPSAAQQTDVPTSGATVLEVLSHAAGASSHAKTAAGGNSDGRNAQGSSAEERQPGGVGMDLAASIAEAVTQAHGSLQPVAISTIDLPSDTGGQVPIEEGSSQRQEWGHVAVGGTFDRLHAGHRILLAATALVATKAVYIGVTGPKLLQNKVHAELLQSYAHREAAAAGYVRLVRPGLQVHTGELQDAKGLAAEVEAIEALVVSEETAKGVEPINADRSARGFPPLEVVTVGLVGAAGGAASKLSSTALRKAEAEAEAAKRQPVAVGNPEEW